MTIKTPIYDYLHKDDHCNGEILYFLIDQLKEIYLENYNEELAKNEIFSSVFVVEYTENPNADFELFLDIDYFDLIYGATNSAILKDDIANRKIRIAKKINEFCSYYGFNFNAHDFVPGIYY